VLEGTEAQTIGIEVPMGEAGDHWVEFSVAECTEEGNIEIFCIPARLVQVAVAQETAAPKAGELDQTFSEPELVDEEEDEAELVTAPIVSEETISLKVGYLSGADSEASVIRRLSVTIGVDENGRHVEAYRTLAECLKRAFKSELDSSCPCALCYTDECGVEVSVTCDLDVGSALRAPAKGGVIRLSIRQ